MVQYVRQQDQTLPLFTTDWAYTKTLLNDGGAAIEGLEMLSIFFPDDSSSTYMNFSQKFRERFKRDPGFGAVYSYDAVLTLAQALRASEGNLNDLSKSLAGIKVEGVLGEISLDEYGDVKRDSFILVVRRGQFELISAISPN